MGTPVGREAWQDLIQRFVAQRRRLLAACENEEATSPNPGATESQLLMAERRLGRPLDPQYRELLSVADGWDYFYLFFSLLGTAELGAGSRWESASESAEIWFEDAEWGEEIGGPDDGSVYQPLVVSDNGYSSTAFLLAGAADRLPAGAVIPLPPESTYPDLYSYLANELDEIIRHATYTDSEGAG
ncbi:SMI1/KNR4 family protein [Nocardia carnea]|uniref:SMI1/KNR4 family protein n=1 Tax=Nocardia carnea TaxID=37328 RepID=UPI0024565A01|nr:SMI1/KNR4 family protein [Nocardia carnea]